MAVSRKIVAKESQLQVELKAKLHKLQDEFKKCAMAKDFDAELYLKLRGEIDTLHYKIQASKDRAACKSGGLEERTLLNNVK